MKQKDLAPYAIQGEPLPPGTELAGFAALVHSLGVKAPLRAPLATVAPRHVKGGTRDDDHWRIYDKRYRPKPTFADHLSFALRHENIDPLVLKRIFEAVPSADLESFVRGQPTGRIPRRVWFFYETLLGRRLDVPDAGNVPAIDALERSRYVTATPALSRRHRVRNNLLGTGTFLPIIRRTKAIEAHLAKGLEEKAREIIGRTGAHVLSRAASFLLLADSRASFEIEGERPPRSRLERWGKAVLQAGKNPLTLQELLRLQTILIEDTRFVQPGVRTDGVFLGDRDHRGDPLPEFIGARPEDLEKLLTDMQAVNDRMGRSGIHPVLQAAITAFAFVYIHPLSDGNGRVHRCIIHHVLADRRFSPQGLVFPVSAVMQDRIDDYRETLRDHSGPLMDYITWRATPNRNVEVLNDTGDLYRYFDATAEAEFLFGCVARTIEVDLPREIDYLQRYDLARSRIMERVEMQDRLAEDLIMFIRQNKGRLSNKRRKKEFAALTDNEVRDLELIVQDAFEDAPLLEREKEKEEDVPEGDPKEVA